MAKDNWIPVREQLPETDEWVIVQTQDGTCYPATYSNSKWSPLFRGGLVEHLMHGKVAYWQPHEAGYPYVQCQCGAFFLQAEGRKECPVCAVINREKKPRAKAKEKAEEPVETAPKPEEPIPFADEEELLDVLDE